MMSSLANLEKLDLKYPFFADLGWELAGSSNPISLPVIDFSTIEGKLGQEIGSGNCGIVYSIPATKPARVCKFIPKNSFINGNEIRILEIASKVGVAPAFHGAFIAKAKSETFVVLEMDHGGITLKQWMEKFKDRSDLPEEKIINLIFKNSEYFYKGIFKNIKLLALNNIIYRDLHPGNIIFSFCSGKGVQLIDFDAAKFKNTGDYRVDVCYAAATALKYFHISEYFENFKQLPNLSSESRELIEWFSEIKQASLKKNN